MEQSNIIDTLETYHELVVGVVDKPGETVARLFGHAVVEDEDMIALLVCLKYYYFYVNSKLLS